MDRSSQQQQRHKLQRRQRMPQVPVEQDIPGVSVSIPPVAVPSGIPGGSGGPGRGVGIGNGNGNGPPTRAEAEEDEDNGGTLSAW